MKHYVFFCFCLCFFEFERLLLGYCWHNGWSKDGYFIFVWHVFVFFLLFFGVFCKAIRGGKMFRKFCGIEEIILALYTGILAFVPGYLIPERGKLFVFCLYFVVLKHCLPWFDEVASLRVFLILFAVYAFIYFSLPLHQRLHVKNWFSAFSVFLGLYCLRFLTSDIMTLCAFVVFDIFLYFIGGVFSLLVYNFIVPLFIYRKMIFAFFSVLLAVCFIFCIVHLVHGSVSSKLKHPWEVFMQKYLLGTRARYYLFDDDDKKMNSDLDYGHSFLFAIVESYGVFDVILVSVFVLRYFSLPYTTLFLCFCFTIRTPLYFFVAFYECNAKLTRNKKNCSRNSFFNCRGKGTPAF